MRRCVIIKQKQIIAVLLVLCTTLLLGAGGIHLTEINNYLTGNLTSCVSVQASQSTSAVKMKVIISGTGGTVTNNYYIKKNIPQSQLTSQIVALSKKGTPIIRVGNGSGPKVMIVAGVHGNELPSQIAALKLVNYLKGKSIKGTVYIVPFVIPSNTAKDVRYWKGKNLNRVANIAGTPTNKILKLAKQLNISVLGDFHSTKPGGDPGKMAVFSSKHPTYQSYIIAKYICKKTGSPLIADNLAGVEYRGALEDTTNLAGIPAVTCEVLSPHGTVKSGSVTKSYNQMIALLKYKKII
ncbi:succinylglutamate desuccinylase/aspartoacylase family protein [Methanobacterium sp. MBAC-LM]|uniref:succinylglutamate desuccinylase/aspartoacylase family protein n=1 Tax=Methanobacterium sp. MBAC-LM TaxID=3412034 RepID=UPI003C727672